MEIHEANRLAETRPQPLEDGWTRLDSGLGFVAARTEMPGCSGAMVRWWFDTLETTEQYRLWYPEDHVYLKRHRPAGSTGVVGDTHIVHERLGGEKVLKLKLNFRDPAELLDPERLKHSGVTAAILARGGPLHLPLKTGMVLHVVNDTETGCVMRSRFWMGRVEPAIPIISSLIRADMTSDAALSGLHRHCKAEMANLARILPALYAARCTPRAEAQPLTTFWSTAPNTLAPSAPKTSMRTRSPKAMNGVTGSPRSSFSMPRRSAMQDEPISR